MKSSSTLWRSLTCAITFITLFSFSNVHAAPGDTTTVTVHDNVDMTWFGNYDQVGVFPDGSKTYSKILMHFTMGCASSGCSDWDYTVQLELMKDLGVQDSNVASIDTISTSPLVIDTSWNVYQVYEPFEMGRAITPYGGYMATNSNGYNNDWEHTYTYEVSDFAKLLQDSVLIRAHYSGWSSGFDVTLNFDFIEGTPTREVLDIQNLYSGFTYTTSAEVESNHLPAKDIDIAADVAGSRLRITPSGHGFDNSNNCAEFCQRYYRLYANSTLVAQNTMWRSDCGMNPIYPQGGTWLYDRANWCPGTEVPVFEHELSAILDAGAISVVDLDFESYTWSGSQAPSYILDVQLVTYGPINHVYDAELSDIISPSLDENYSRMNPTCGQPEVVLQNRGSEPLTSALITYGVEGGEPCYYNWTGNLVFMSSANVILPAFNWSGFDPADPTFYATVSMPNYAADENTINDTKRSNFDIPSQHESSFIVYMRTNNAGNETSYRVMDVDGEIVYSGGGYGANQDIRDTLTFDPGCYTLLIEDSGKDGLSWWANSDGTGYARLKSTSGPFIASFQADFGTRIYHPFTVGADLQNVNSGIMCELTSIDENDVLDPRLTLFPNPSAGLIAADINLFDTDDVTLSVYDISGKSVYISNLQNIRNTTHSINMEDQPSGMYLMTVQTSEETISRSFIIHKH